MAVREFVRPLRRAASRFSLSLSKATRNAVLFGQSSAARLPWAAAISRRPYVAATWPYLFGDLRLPASNNNHGRTVLNLGVGDEKDFVMT